MEVLPFECLYFDSFHILRKCDKKIKKIQREPI